MSLHAISHPWEVQDLENGLLVTITPRDLDVGVVSILADDLFELVRENGQRNLTLDFAAVQVLPVVVVGKLFVLDRKLREMGGRLLLRNLNRAVKELLKAESWPVDSTTESLACQDESQECFMVFVRDGTESADRPDAAERRVAACPTYEEAVKVREQLRQSGTSCIIRFVGQPGGGDGEKGVGGGTSPPPGPNHGGSFIPWRNRPRPGARSKSGPPKDGFRFSVHSCQMEPSDRAADPALAGTGTEVSERSSSRTI